jgi:hypothetical protein
MKFREHRGNFDDSMDTVVEVASLEALAAHMENELKPFGVKIAPEDIQVEPYCGLDPRNGWNTHIVTARGYGVLGFLDGPAN